MKKIAIAVLLIIASGFASSDTTDAPIIAKEDIEIGMKGFGLTTFEGFKIDTFDIEVKGVRDNNYSSFRPTPFAVSKLFNGPEEFPVERYGVVAGESGSTIYVYTDEGLKWMGGLAAVPRRGDADAIALVQLAETIMKGSEGLLDNSNASQRFGRSLFNIDEYPVIFNGPFPIYNGLHGLLNEKGLFISEYSYFSESSMKSPDKDKDINVEEAELRPGSAINVYLVTGDIKLFANGTVTMVDDSTFLAFAHQFFGNGKTNLPAAMPRMITTVANDNYGSYKYPESDGKYVGVVEHDYFWGLKGTRRKQADMIPFTFQLRNSGIEEEVNYSVARVPDRTDWIMAVMTYYSLYGGYHVFDMARQSEEGSAKIVANLEIDGFEEIQLPPYIAAYSSQTSAEQAFSEYIFGLFNNVFTPLSENGLSLISVSFDIEYSTEHDFLKIARVEFDPKTARHGETVNLLITLQAKESQEGQDEFHRTIPFTIPASAVPEKVTVQIKTGNNLSWGSSKDGEELSPEEVLQRISSFTNTALFIKADFDKSNIDVFNEQMEKKYNVVIDGTEWERIHREKQHRFYITVFDRLATPGDEIKIIADHSLTITVRKESFLFFK